MDLLLQAFIFVFGAVIGSFLNAVVWRMRTGESFLTGRSYCPHCRHMLAAKDLVPALSYLLLRGKCRYCRGAIHPQYITVELATGLLFLLAARHDLAAVWADPERALMILLLHWYLIAVLVVVFVFDLRYMLILRSVTLPATAIAAAAQLALGVHPAWLLVSCAVGGGIFFLQYALSRGTWVGGGDRYLGLLMGAALAWPGILVALMLAYVIGAVVALGFVAFGGKTWKSQIPFGTFLSAATVATMLWGDAILAWYIGLL